jgi:putative peptide zinc metalloprotease protein
MTSTSNALTDLATGDAETSPRRRTGRLRRFVPGAVVALALALGVGWASPASAAVAGTAPTATVAAGDNTAVAVNTKDGSSVFRFAFKISRVMGETVQNTNAAIAYASCTDCQTVAVAIQVVLVSGSPTTYTPTNEAIAINDQCNLCDTLASAYQFVLQGSGPMHFTPNGQHALADLKRQMEALRHSTLSGTEIQAKLDDLTAQLRTILSTDLVSGPPPRDADGSAVTTSTQPGSTGSSTTTSRPSTSSTVAPSTSAPSNTTSSSTTPSSTTGSTTTTQAPATTSTSTTSAP